LKASIEGGAISGMVRLLVLLLVNSAGIGIALAAPPAPQHDIEVMLAADSAELRVTDRVLVTQRERYRFRLTP